MHQNKEQKHIPVLLEPVLHYLYPQEGESYLDLTAGYGGHASVVLERTLQPGRATLVDRDQFAVKHLSEHFGSGIHIIHKDYLGASQELVAENASFDMILADLGVSSPHLDKQERGFSIQEDGPLDMRMDQTQSLTADTIVNSYDEVSLEDILRRYGEEPRARAVARLIVGNRPITSTARLASIVAQAWPGYSRTHPATRTFQALRIAVNDELNQLDHSLPLWLELLNPGGRLAVISFHSLEDRLVKHFFADNTGGYDAPLELLTKKPVMASNAETVFNPRARSAKLRAVAKIKN